MPEAIYVPRHDTQYEPRTDCSKYDCNMAAAADALRFWTLGLIDRNHHQLRAIQPGGTAECSDSSSVNNGTTLSEVVHVLDHYGVKLVAYDTGDGKDFADVLATLTRGECVVAHGDYGSVPPAMRGPIDRTFTGLHSVIFQRRLAVDGRSGVRVGDGLSDQWMWWPDSVASAYMRDFPGSGYQFVRVIPRKATSKAGVVNVRAAATRSSAIVRTMTTTTRLHYGGTVIGESIGGNRTWFKVWAGTRGAGYCHSSVARVV